MFTKLLEVAKKFNIDVTGITEENSEVLVTKINDAMNNFKMKSDTLAAEAANLKTELTKYTEQRVTDLVDGAIAEGKIKPADKEKYISFAKFSYEDAKNLFTSLPVDPALKKDVVPPASATGAAAGSGAAGAADKFTDTDGKPLSYEKFMDYCMKDPKYADKFTDADIAKLKEKYTV